MNGTMNNEIMGNEQTAVTQEMHALGTLIGDARMHYEQALVTRFHVPQEKDRFANILITHAKEIVDALMAYHEHEPVKAEVVTEDEGESEDARVDMHVDSPNAKPARKKAEGNGVS